MSGFVTIEEGLGPDGRIAVVRFDRGDGINAMSPEALRQLTDAARSFEDDSATSVVVLTGGAKSFTAGFDLKDPEGRSRTADRKPFVTSSSGARSCLLIRRRASGGSSARLLPKFVTIRCMDFAGISARCRRGWCPARLQSQPCNPQPRDGADRIHRGICPLRPGSGSLVRFQHPQFAPPS